MRQRIQAAAAVLAAALLLSVGYLSTATSAQVGTFVVVGDHLTLDYGDGTYTCVVADVRADFVRCEREKPSPFSKNPEYEQWLNLRAARSVDRMLNAR